VQAADFQSTIDPLIYAPAEISAKVGDTIEVNKDALAHTATANNNDWDMMVGPNKTARPVLTKPGEVDYYCKFHPRGVDVANWRSPSRRRSVI
jgi:plastocyanin